MYWRQTIRMPTPYTKAISSTSASTELRSRNADAMAASNRAMALSGIRWRSRNCCTSGPHASVHHQLGTDQQGQRHQVTDVNFHIEQERYGRPPPSTRPSRAESTRSGSQANSEMTMMRRRTIIIASSDRCARRRSWKSGPPRTSEKSGVSRSRTDPTLDSGVGVFTSGLATQGPGTYRQRSSSTKDSISSHPGSTRRQRNHAQH